MKKVLKGLRYSLYLIFRPFDGFWDLKHEKRGNAPAALIIVFLLSITYIMRRQLTGFIFNLNDLERLNIFVELLSVLIPFALWCIANWSLTTLMEGEGSFKDILITSAYALTPMILVNLFLVIISNVLTLDEGAFYYFFDGLGFVWAGLLLIVGTMVVHQYTLMRTLATTVFIVVGMGLIMFIGLLFFSLLQQMYSFFYVIYREITFRL